MQEVLFIRTSCHVRQQIKAERVGAAVRNALRKGRLLVFSGGGELFRIQISREQLGMELMELNTIHDVDWVDHIAQRLGHFPAFRISNQRVTVHLLEGHLASQFDAKHDHARNPEEENIPSGF